MTPRKRLDMRVLRRMAIPLALVLAASFLVFPGGVLAASGPGPGADSGKATSMSLKELAKTRPYYAPDVAARTNPLSGELDRVAQKSVPSELLLASLLPQRSDETLKQNAGTGLAGAGTGGWTELKRMYMPSSDPDVTYRLYPGDSNNNVIDINGRRHDIYARRVSTDVSQPPDPAGIARKDLARIYYSTYSEGSWSNPINLTPTAGFQDTAAVLFETDDRATFTLSTRGGRGPGTPLSLRAPPTPTSTATRTSFIDTGRPMARGAHPALLPHSRVCGGYPALSSRWRTAESTGPGGRRSTGRPRRRASPPGCSSWRASGVTGTRPAPSGTGITRWGWAWRCLSRPRVSGSLPLPERSYSPTEH